MGEVWAIAAGATDIGDTGEHSQSEQEPDQRSQTRQISQVHVTLRTDYNQPLGERRIPFAL